MNWTQIDEETKIKWLAWANNTSHFINKRLIFEDTRLEEAYQVFEEAMSLYGTWRNTSFPTGSAGCAEQAASVYSKVRDGMVMMKMAITLMYFL